jgi:hypothetical protein
MKDDSRDWLPGGRSMHYILDAQHQPQSAELLEWANWLEAERVKPVGSSLMRVADTLLVGKLRVSTVFLGLDHRFGGEGPPILFESMAFYPASRHRQHMYLKLRGKETRIARRGQTYHDDIAGQRYSTWDEAIAGHQRMVAAVRRLRPQLLAARAAGDQHRAEQLHSEVQRRSRP